MDLESSQPVTVNFVDFGAMPCTHHHRRRWLLAANHHVIHVQGRGQDWRRIQRTARPLWCCGAHLYMRRMNACA